MQEYKLTNKLIKHLYSSDYYPIKRSFGKTLQTCNINAIIAYRNLADLSLNANQREIEFLLAGLCFYTNSPNKEITKHVTYETLLKRLAATEAKQENKPRTAEIENFLKLRLDNKGYFQKKFATLTNKVITVLDKNETIDFDELFNDLSRWDKDNNVKLKWAMTIANVKKEDN